ncbi:tether containing UBX domain for GLUT4 isoform X3 [Enhydra lutris kenyoni]|uniref:Tether containing UBX domain for GLUT4 isoform X3 n=1 Tax=Enhydra lutris kenyoni TaxID=391180 RepID=A0A2Y9KYT1_ENHLU|nr:tether containing UBX domain for GLUT4 isoform X3 [Enhydra lutris kenyoni]XP_022379248.1 tether containing UBX domain for GLUT4 isoform X3 [Enhydra lutris kenyoni]
MPATGLQPQRIRSEWRFANLPNNAKLEMVPISRSREGPKNTVRIALQLDDGSRLQDTFCSGQTLWELLSHFAQTRECLEQLSEASPVCVYMRDEVTGRASLQATTLKSLGLTGGSAIIRFAVKRCSSAGVSRSKAPGSPTASLSADQAAGSPLPPLDSAGLSRGDVSHQDEADISGAGRVDAPAKQISKEPAPAPAPFVPFSGGGQRLGGPSGSARPLMSPSAKLPKSFSSPGGPSKPKKSRPGQEPRPEAEPPVDRDPVVCHPDLEELLQAWPAELPDEFFEVTVDDVRRRLAQLKSERKRLEEAPLVTKAFRDAQRREKLERYPKVVLRVLFPDRYILQGFFRPSETVGDLQAFVRSHLGDPELPFYLFITPPKTVLDDPTLTLFQASAGNMRCALPTRVCFCLTLPVAPRASEGRSLPCGPRALRSGGTNRTATCMGPIPSWSRAVVGRPSLWPEGGLRVLQASSWSLGCWNTRSPHLQLTCWWPGERPQWGAERPCPSTPAILYPGLLPAGACPGLLEPHPRCQPLTLRPSSQSQRPRQGQWACLNPAPEQPSQSGGIWGRSPSG